MYLPIHFRRRFLCQLKLASIATEDILDMSFIGQVNKAKKPLGMALFLPVILIISGFITASGSPPYQRQFGILGGPSASGAESVYPEDNIAMLESVPASVFPYDIQAVSGGNVEEGIMETALFYGNEQGFLGKTPSKDPVSSASQEGPDLKGYFSMPADGFNWGKLHPHNAVDIANACGTDITASAEGLVNETSLGSWDSGYGNYILISHPNGTKTRYAHLQSISVSVGKFVKKGELIGKMGQTGNATGCHVHFEIIGAANPFAR